MSSFDICIHGAGFVGQTLALLLARAGFKVALLSNKPTHPEYTDIRAFALGESAKNVLQNLDAWPAGIATTPVSAMHVYGDTSGNVKFETPANKDALTWIVDVPALSDILNRQVAHNPHIQRFAEHDGLKAKLAARLHVVCEGRHSELRDKLGIDVETIVYPQHAIAARLVCEQVHGGIAWQWFNDQGDVLALLPIGGSHSNQVALVWSLETTHAKQMQSASKEDFENTLQAACNMALGTMTLISELARWPLQLSKIKTWAGQSALGVWVLAGDAAHAIHPMAGQGLNLGLGDAALLAQTIQSTLTSTTQGDKLLRALRGYARERQATASAMSYATDGLHLLFAHPNAAVQQLRNWGMSVFDSVKPLKKQVTMLASHS
jgi:ubiquinone biosynthesis UbiH/UbiF/VisC/COQ6 family hydroxylase